MTDARAFSCIQHVPVGQMLLLVSLLLIICRTDIAIACQNCVSNICNLNNGKCTHGCKAGYFGDRCDKDCPTICLRCVSLSNCTVCDAGYYGQLCEQACPPWCLQRQCEKESGDCTLGCTAGYYGNKCDTRCPSSCFKCQQNFDVNQYCGKCNKKYYGTYCQYRCPKYCAEDICDKNYGTCTSGCVTGYYGHLCDQCAGGYFKWNSVCYPCQTHCTTCEHNGMCLSCDVGYTGDTCNSCAIGYYRDTNTGLCSSCRLHCMTCTWQSCQSCDSGWYGDTCDSACSIGCHGGTCNKNDGSCTCRIGYKGGHCNLCDNGYYMYNSQCNKCPSKCISCTYGASVKVCQQCLSGYYGSICQVQCPTGCKNNICEKNSGKCKEGCNVGFYGDFCSACSIGCEDNCDEISGNCDCKKGFTGDQCEQCRIGTFRDTDKCIECPEQCSICTSAHYCSSCKDGYFGPTCTSSCFRGCNNSVCEKIVGRCLQGCNEGFQGDKCDQCKDGKWGERCDKNCPSKCISCSSDTVCGQCSDGFYGIACSSSCPSNCKTCTDSTACDVCKVGYFGNLCNQKCLQNCLTCSYATQCDLCQDGFTGSQCASTCDNKCHSCLNSHATLCTQCAHGRFDRNWIKWNSYTYSYCSLSCSKYCLNGFCDDKSGKCLDGCVAGYGGDFCNCPTGCADNCKTFTNPPSCNLNSCDAGLSGTQCSCSSSHCNGNSCTSCRTTTWYTDGATCCQCSGTCKGRQCSDYNKCTNGCIDGFFGDTCENRCLDFDRSCLKCTANKCFQCTEGYYPVIDQGTCHRCSKKCVNDMCSSTNGTCLEGCVRGYWGAKCDNKCDFNCKECDRYSGVCNVCTYGRYRRDCSAQCSDRCRSAAEKDVCEIENGKCLNGCIHDVIYGNFCELSCNETCVGKECNWETGKCSRGCIKDKYGAWCENSCSDNCIESNQSRCSELDGECNLGCKIGFFGSKCVTNCGLNCLNKTCARETGDCLHGCLDGFEGQICASAIRQPESDNIGTIAGASAGGVVLLLLIIGLVVVLMLVRRRKIKEPRTHDNSKSKTGHSTLATDEPGPVYSNSSATVNLNLRPSRVTKMSNRVYENHGHISLTNSVALESDPDFIVIEETGETPVEEEEEEDAPDLSSGDVDIRDDASDMYYNASAITRVSIDRLEEYVARKPKESLEQEFLSFPKTLIKPYGDSQKPINVPRNRYRGVYPYDFNRVKLQTGTTDYINASYIDGYEKKNEYIAALGPTDKTTEDFVTVWSMIWQEQIEKIVMLTNLTEGGKMKCHQYWPDPGTNQQYGDVTVTCMAEDKTAEFTIRTMSVTMNDKKRVLYHFHYTAWPDRGVPDDVTGLIEFRDKVLGVNSTLDGPVMVHCSAGVGRTGTYIALDYLTNEGEETESMDVFECVSNLRQQRIWMVQTEEQYVYLHDAVVHSLTFDSKPIPSEKFQDYLRAFTPEKLQKNYEHLKFGQDRRKPEEKKSVQKNSSYKNKNNPTADIPGDRYRPKLHLDRVHGSCDYINAVYVDSFTARNSYIVAMTPLKSTIEDFLTLIFQDHIPCIVDMQPHPQNKKHVGEYLPADNQEVTHGDYDVKSTKVKSNSQFILRRLAITRNAQNGPEERIFYHYQLVDWDDKSSTPPSPPDFINFVREVEVKAKEDFEDGKILVHCVSGAERSGLFCAVSVMLQKMESEHEISVVNTVRQIKSRRQRALPNKEQYLFCHQCISAYLDTFDTYSNFAIRQ